LRQLSTAEDLEGGVAADLEPAAGLLACIGTVNLNQVDWWIVGQQGRRGLFKLGLEPLAVTAPGTNTRKDLGHHEINH